MRRVSLGENVRGGFLESFSATGGVSIERGANLWLGGVRPTTNGNMRRERAPHTRSGSMRVGREVMR
jgi:hypothetical protein